MLWILPVAFALEFHEIWIEGATSILKPREIKLSLHAHTHSHVRVSVVPVNVD